MSERKYTKNHEWISEHESNFHVGISEHAQNELGDITFVELPQIGAEFKQGSVFATIESVKAVGEVYAPVDMKIVGINENLESNPALVNSSAQLDGWLVAVEAIVPEQLNGLMSAGAYIAFISASH